MNAEAHRDREKGKKHTYVFQEIFKSATMNTFISNPISAKKYNCAYREKPHNYEIVLKNGISILYVENGHT